MRLQLSDENNVLCAKPESKQSSPLHEGALVSLPVEKIMERKTQKGSSNLEFSLKKETNVYI